MSMGNEIRYSDMYMPFVFTAHVVLTQLSVCKFETRINLLLYLSFNGIVHETIVIYCLHNPT